MLIPTLLYHDVVPGEDWSSSGFPGGAASVYKLSREDFTAHLDRLADLRRPPLLVEENAGKGDWRLSFDDGGISALTFIAPELERRGWRGHFFMPTGSLGKPGFLDARQLRELAARGHCIGSHSVTHPLQMASCPEEQLEHEWRESVDTLEEILGHRPRVASIPGGAFSETVAETAGRAGIRVLFTSEPTARTWQVGPVLCLGRFNLWRGMGPEVALSCATLRGFWPLRQRAAWEVRKGVKRLLGPRYLRMREAMLAGAAVRGQQSVGSSQQSAGSGQQSAPRVARG